METALLIVAAAASLAPSLTRLDLAARFDGPVGIRCHADGRIFIVDDLAHRIVVFNGSGAQLQVLGRHGGGRGELLWPDTVHFDSDGLLYIADAGANRIQVWGSGGEYIREFGRGPRLAERAVDFGVAVLSLGLLAAIALRLAVSARGGTPISPVAAVLWAAGFVAAIGWTASAVLSTHRQVLHNPRDVLVGDDGFVYVADYNSDAVRVFEKRGRLRTSIGRSGSGAGELSRPLGLALSGDGLIYVTDSGNHRIQVFTTAGAFVRQLGRRGRAIGEFESPHGIALGPDGLVYVADRENRRIQVLTPDGTFVRAIGTDPESLAGGFRPAGICFAGDGRLLVVDIEGHRVLGLVPQAPEPGFPHRGSPDRSALDGTVPYEAD